MTSEISKCVLVICTLVLSSGAVNFLPSIQWSPYNPIFDNLKGHTRKVNEDDELRIWCPKKYTQDIKTTYQLHQANLYFALYKVETKEEYDSCDARKGKLYLYCNDPTGASTDDNEQKQIVFLKQPFSDYMDAFPPGKTYYFIGTSGGEKRNIDRKVGGKCSSHNMKLAIHVCKKEENCSVDVLNGGWSLWKVNEETGLCERNCTNPAPQNGGYPCSGTDKIDCSKIISGKKENPTTAKESTTTEISTVKETRSETTLTTLQQQNMKTTRVTPTTKTQTAADNNDMPKTSEKMVLLTTEPTSSSLFNSKSALDERKEVESENDDVTLSMKGAVLTFVGLFILGCVVGIVQVLVILHVRSKRSVKHPEPQNPVNHV